MDRQQPAINNNINCKSILKRKSLEIVGDGPAGTAPADDSQNNNNNNNNINNNNSNNNNSCSSSRPYCRRQPGILKKHSSVSLDDEWSLQKPILKNRRQSCDEETMLGYNELHSILKRKTSEQQRDDGPEPHGILKKRVDAAVHQPSPPSVQSSSAAAAAAADCDDIRPILKQKKFEAADHSDEHHHHHPAVVRPILKKNTAASRGNSPAGPRSGSGKRLSVAQRVSDLESCMAVREDGGGAERPSLLPADAYRKPVRENGRVGRDRCRFYTQPVTPSEIKAIKKTTRSENNTVTTAAVHDGVSTPPPPPSNRSTGKLQAADRIACADNIRDTPVRVPLKRVGVVSAKTREFHNIFDKTTAKTAMASDDVNSNFTTTTTTTTATTKTRSSKYKQCQEKKLSVANRYSTQPVTDYELQEAKHLNNAKCKKDGDNNGRPPRRKLGRLILDRLRIFNGNTCTIDVDQVEKKIDLNNIMEESTDRLKEQPNDKIKKSPESNHQSKDEKSKIPEIKIQPVKSLKEPNDSERLKNRISRNVAINRSFNSNSKLELLRQQKFGVKSKENDEFSKFKKHVESSNDNIDGTSVINGGSIKDRLVALKKSGQTDWQKRILKIKPEDHEVSNNSINVAQDLLRKQLTRHVKSAEEPIECVDKILVDRLNRLETSSKDWKKRIEQKDTTNFTVAGKMQNKSLPPLTPILKSVIPRSSLDKSSTNIVRKKMGEESTKQTNVRRSLSMSDSKTKSYLNNKFEKVPLENGSNITEKEKTVNVPIMIDDDFDKFFVSSIQTSKDTQISDIDFDDLKSIRPNLLVQRKKVKVQFRKHEGSKNPLKALATNHDLAQQQYTENKTNLLLQRSLETSTIKTPMAREALAALASKEDFAAVNLRKSGDLTPTLLPPYKDLMLLHLKGRRRVQTRLVPPIANSVNQGDCYVLVTSSQLFVWIGEYSNVIERSHAAKVAQSILDKKDLGCKSANQLYTINCDSSLPNSQHEKKFWTLLGVDETSSFKGHGAGHPDEDELYESAIVATNAVYEVVDDELVVLTDILETMPKIEILDPSKTLVFDFGSEVYVWYGKNVNINKRRPAVRLARQLFDDGYDYSQHDVSPIDVASCLGDRNKDTVYVKSGTKRPEWTLFAKITQHMETVLFREKFADWPDYSRVIRLSKKNDDKEKNGEHDTCVDWSTDIKAFDAEEMLKMSVPEPDLVLEGSHLGRGSFYYDKDTLRDFVVNTVGVTVWHVQEFDSTELDSKSVGQFHSGDSYILRWTYNVSIRGRELSGLPSRRMVKSGRNRCAYWYWHGRSATQNDQGAAALLTVQLDTEQGPQLRVDQGHEPPAFWNLFKGSAVVYRGKRNETSTDTWRLFMVHGANEDEAHLTEVACSTTQLRSQTSFVLVDSKNGTVFIWHGSGSSDVLKELSLKIVNCLSEVDNAFGLTEDVALREPKIVDETKEPSEFFKVLGCMNSRRLHISHQPSRPIGDNMKLFHYSSVLGNFKASLVASAYVPSPYPYLQDHLYNVSQPATFMLDTGEELWLWQGWWPETAADDNDKDDEDEDETSRAADGEQPVVADHRGSLSTRLQAERRAAMQTALDYWNRKYGDDVDPKAYLVWAGLEPLRFTDCFPEWHDRDDIAEINMKHDHKPGETLAVETELARVTQESYPAAQLLQRPLPDGVDPTRLELYLSPASFKSLLDMSKTEFLQLPKWKRTKIKQSVGLF